MVITTIIIVGVLKWNIFIAALVSVVAWNIIGALLKAGKSGSLSS